MAKPSLVLVHGSWHCPAHFDALREDLAGHGYRTVAVALPSTQSPDTPPASLEDDTLAVRDTVRAELDAGNDVVVVAHSYGGVPANNALEGFDLKSRQRAGASTYVRSIVFMASMPLPAGITFLSVLGGKPLPLHDMRTPEFAWVGEPGPEYYFYNEQTPADAAKFSAMLRPQSWEAYKGETKYAAMLNFPTYYLCCTKDQAFRYEAQQALLAQTKSAGANMTVETIDSDHTPFTGKFLPKTSEFLRKAASER